MIDVLQMHHPAGDTDDAVLPDEATVNRSLATLARSAREHLGMDVAFIAEFKDGHRVFRQVDTAPGTPGLAPGASDPLEATYCQRLVDGRLPLVIPDVRREPEAAQLPVTDRLGIGSYIGIPLNLDDGTLYGTFCVFGHAPSEGLGEREVGVLRFLGQLASRLVQQDLDRRRDRHVRQHRVRQVLENDSVSIVYQPIMATEGLAVCGYEALSRFGEEPRRGPDAWFHEAAAVGLGPSLEIGCVRKALRALGELPDDQYLSVNIAPSIAVMPQFVEMLGQVDLRRVALEVTEHSAVGDYATLGAALEPLRERGLRVAVDDAGAGYASFRHILHLRPDLIKLDMSLTRDVDKDVGRRALVASLIQYAREIGAKLVAEGVETDEELGTLRQLGVPLAQGFLLGRPGPLVART